jgi:hypothetical protein
MDRWYHRRRGWTFGQLRTAPADGFGRPARVLPSGHSPRRFPALRTPPGERVGAVAGGMEAAAGPFRVIDCRIAREGL